MKKTGSTKEELLSKRLEGTMPVVDLAGDDFTVAWKDKELMLEHGSGSKINLADLPLDADAQNYLCFYHLPTKSAVVIPEDITKIPDDIVLLKIPHEFFLDPVGAARQYGLEDTFLLKQYPLREKIKAEVIAVEASGLPELVKSNQEKNKEQKARSRLHPGNLFKRSKTKGKGM
jgi:hypothetical protein